MRKRTFALDQLDQELGPRVTKVTVSADGVIWFNKQLLLELDESCLQRGLGTLAYFGWDWQNNRDGGGELEVWPTSSNAAGRIKIYRKGRTIQARCRQLGRLVCGSLRDTARAVAVKVKVL